MTQEKEPTLASAAEPYFDRWDELYRAAFAAVMYGVQGSSPMDVGGASKDEALEYAADFFRAAGVDFIRWVQDNYHPEVKDSRS